jgi:MinD-like ATPase involved in chromosome partitioning or flagellar assembly
MSGPAAVLVAASGATWEAEALELLERAAGLVVVKRCVDLVDLLATASAGAASAAVLSPALPGLDADSIAALRRHGLGLVLVAASDELLDSDPERLRRLGVEHLLASTDLATLADTVAEAVAPVRPVPDDPAASSDVAPGTPDAGRVVAVWGPNGAPGRTTVAVGIAAELARGGREVLLVDADDYGGAVAQHLGVLDEVSGLLAAARAANTGRLDVPGLAGAARQVCPRLRVLTGLPRPDRWQEVRPQAFADLLDLAARLVPLVVLDLGFSLESDPVDPYGPSTPQRNQMTLAGLARADDVVVVGSADPVGLARLGRGLVELRAVLPAVRPRVVVNRTRASLGWNEREVRGLVEGFLQVAGASTTVDLHFLPDDRAAADRALLAGRSLAESGDSALRQAVAELAHALLGDGADPGRRRVRGGGRRGARRGVRRRRAARAR